MMRFGPFSRSSEHWMLSAIAARIGTDRSGMTSAVQHATGMESPYEPEPPYHHSPDGCLCVLLRLADKYQIAERLRNPKPHGTRSNKTSLCGDCRDFGIGRSCDRIHQVATNGQSNTHLPSARPTAQRSVRSHDPLLKRCPSGRSRINGEVLCRTVGPRTSPDRSQKRERVDIPCVALTLRERKVALKRSQRLRFPRVRAISDAASNLVGRSFNRMTLR